MQKKGDTGWSSSSPGTKQLSSSTRSRISIIPIFQVLSVKPRGHKYLMKHVQMLDHFLVKSPFYKGKCSLEKERSWTTGDICIISCSCKISVWGGRTWPNHNSGSRQACNEDSHVSLKWLVIQRKAKSLLICFLYIHKEPVPTQRKMYWISLCPKSKPCLTIFSL